MTVKPKIRIFPINSTYLVETVKDKLSFVNFYLYISYFSVVYYLVGHVDGPLFQWL